ncbi:hypothetical protein Dda_5122 [Drechslerella dactyloides]|uniref:BAH domain-containing protein n=1 Tax=Drechslerella dactyloides TaxID=74499 RepID=A0AAD6IXQ5_DREDA|nr:hypothetical protein Dda_5122 [Drechslerella dactyloides]
MPGRTLPGRAASQKARLNQARQLLRGKRATKGQIERDDSDDELGDDDVPWTWIYPDSNGPLSPVSANKTPADNLNAKKRRRDGSPVNQVEEAQAKPIGAKCGTFECRVGDIILLKADGKKAAWVGLAVDFGGQDDDMQANIMWFSTHSEVRNRGKKRTDHIPYELYITPSFDWNPLESINGKAEVLSEKAFNAEFPNSIPAKSAKKGKVFLCRRACDVRPARYSEEFDWDDLYHGPNTDLEKLKEWVKEKTAARSSKKAKDADFEMHVDASSDEDSNIDEGASDEDRAVPKTPRKNKKRRRSVTTPRAKATPSKKFLTPSHRKIATKKALTFTPLSMRTLSPATHLASPYQIARNRLHVSSVPDSLPCRETEFGTVFTHLHDAITTGSGSCIYISGTPGTGKTATVREVISQLQVQVEEDELEDFIFLEINGMKITDPHQSYSLLWEAIQGDSEGPARVAPNHALNLLEREFSTPSPRRVPIVVLMDELDQLVTKNQSVMYNFFNWPSMVHSRLIVLAVANTMDLPERTLSNKISSRLGLTRITFPGYTHEQLKKIIESRLEGVPGNIVQSDAIQFAARKVAAVSGDARRALDICRRAVELVEQANSNAFPPTPSKSAKKAGAAPVPAGPAKVTIQTIMKAINEATHSPMQMYLKNLPLSAKILLAAILGRMRRSGVNENVMGDVIEDAERLVRMAASSNVTDLLLTRDGVRVGERRDDNMFLTPRKGGRPAVYQAGDEDLPRVQGLVSAAAGLADGGILSLEMGRRGERAGRVRLNIGEEEVKAALKDDPDVGGMGFEFGNAGIWGPPGQRPPGQGPPLGQRPPGEGPPLGQRPPVQVPSPGQGPPPQRPPPKNVASQITPVPPGPPIGEEQKLEIDTWIRNLYMNEEEIRKTVETGIRTTGLTTGNFDDTPRASPAPRTAAQAPAALQRRPENGLFHTWGDHLAQRRLQQKLANQQQSRPQRPPGPGKFKQQQRGAENRPPPRKQLEGPAHDTRKLNDGDRLARQHDREPTAYYLFPTTNKDAKKEEKQPTRNERFNANDKHKGKNEKKEIVDVESGIMGADRHHINAIAELTGTHMKFPQDEPQDWADAKKTIRFNRIRIWGTPEAVDRAKEYLVYLNKHADKSAQSAAKKSLNWAKVKAIPDKRHRDAATKEEKEREEKGRFRSFPDPNEVFPYTGVFAWPQSEVSPAEVLGMNYESLDPIRLEVGVYIVYSSKRHCFRVLGYDQESIQKALDRIYVVFCEVAARNRASIGITLAIPPKLFQPQVLFDKDHELSNLPVSFKPEKDSVGVQLYLGDDGSCQQHKNWTSRHDILTLANESFMKSALDMTLKDLFYLRMFAKFRIYFGTFILFGYRRPRFLRHGLEEFIEMLRVAMARGEIFRQVGSPAVGERLLNLCEMRTDLFHPASPYEVRDAEGRMEPVYSSSMYLVVTRKPDPPVEIKLEVEFEKSPKTGEYRVSARRWLRLPRTTEETTRVMKKRTPLDLKLVDLEANVAYEIELTIGQAVPDIDKMPVLAEFVLHLNLVDSKDGNTKRVSYITLPGIKVVSIVTKKKYPYWFTGTPYIFEVTQYEHIRGIDDTVAKKDAMSGGFPTDFSNFTTTDVRWGVSLYNSEWDAIFTKQSELPIGCTGDWVPSVDEFFATTGGKIESHHAYKGKGKADKEVDGFRGLMDKIQTCVKIIAEVKAKVKADRRAKEGLKPEMTMQQLVAADDAARKELEKGTVLIETAVQDDRFWYASGEISTGAGEDDGEDDEENDASTPEEEDLYTRPPVPRAQPVKARRVVRQSSNTAKTVVTQDFSAYGDTEYSRQAKATLGLEESDTESRYGESEYSRYARPGKEKYGLQSDTASGYGDSEYSRAEKERGGLK